MSLRTVSSLRAKLFVTLPVIAAGVMASAALFPGTASADTPTVGTMASKIEVPSSYVYNPDLGSLHDYCTSSPDGFGNADFRGPCARHDMCYEAPGQHKSACDSELKAGITNNCLVGYPDNPGTCNATGMTYYAAVVAFGDDPASTTGAAPGHRREAGHREVRALIPGGASGIAPGASPVTM